MVPRNSCDKRQVKIDKVVYYEGKRCVQRYYEGKKCVQGMWGILEVFNNIRDLVICFKLQNQSWEKHNVN